MPLPIPIWIAAAVGALGVIAADLLLTWLATMTRKLSPTDWKTSCFRCFCRE